MANTPELTHSFTLTVGDYSRDGHNQSDTTLFKANKSLADIKKSHGMASKLHSMYLEHQCEEYEDSRLKPAFVTKARAAFHAMPEALGMSCLEVVEEDGETDEDAGYIDSGEFCDLYLFIAKLVDPDLEWKEQVGTAANENIGGYGLFYN